MGTLDYLDRRPHKPRAAGEGGTVYLHSEPITIEIEKKTIEVIID
jgi:hypothetical protein